MTGLRRLGGLALLVAATVASAASGAPVVLNPSFEDNSNAGSYGALNDWTQTPNPSGLPGYTYLSGTSTFGQFPWDNGTVPGEGTTGQVGFIQVYSGVTTLALDQTVSGFTVGQTYTLSYYENSRAGTSTPTTEAEVNGVDVVLPHLDTAVGNNPFRHEVSLPFVATSTSMTIELRVTQVTSGDDATGTFDKVSISPVPEPASCLLLGLGAVGLALVARRRRSA